MIDYIFNYIFSRFETEDEIEFDSKNRVMTINEVKIFIPLIDIVRPRYYTIFNNYTPFYRLKARELKLNIINERDYEISWDFITETFDHLTLRYGDNYIGINKPILDMKIFVLTKILSPITNLKYKKYNKKAFVICSSHDIDRTGNSLIYRFVTYTFQAFKQFRPKLLLGPFRRNKDLNVKEILEIEKEVEAKSTWFILSKKGFRRNADFKMKSRSFKKVLKTIRESKNEIGLHFPYIDFTKENVEREESKFDFTHILGVRNHYLRGEFNEIVKLYDDCGFMYDSTFGFNEKPSFRFGTSVPFHPLVGDQVLDIYEIPMNLMDFQEIEHFEREVQDLFNILSLTSGVWVINWHNNRFNEFKYGKKIREKFEFILKEANSRGAWITSINEFLVEYKKQTEGNIND